MDCKMKIAFLPLLLLLGFASSADPGLCHVCQCPHDILPTKNVVNCRNLGLKTMPEWDLGAADEVYLIMKFTFNDFEQITQDMIPHRRDVYQMFFDDNNISYIGPNAFCRLPEIKYLSLSGNKLERIGKDAFKSCNDTDIQLMSLDLSVNRLHTLDGDLFDDLHDLDELNLDENEFVSIDISTTLALNKLHRLTRLHLARNKLHELHPGLSTPIKTLNYLSLAANELEVVPPQLWYAKNMAELIIDDNPISVINGQSFVGLENLRVLNMSRMSRLKLIDRRSFEPLTSLTDWHCSINYELKSIHPEMFGTNKPTSLVTVDLSQNGLTTLDKNVLGWWEGQSLNIQNNPFFCDCHLVWLKFRNTDPELTKEIRCESGPPAYKDQLLSDLSDSSILCEAPPNNFRTESQDYAMLAAVASIASFTIIVIAVAIVAIVRTRQAASSWTDVRYTKATENEYY